MNKYELLKSMIHEGQQIVVFTGAGISVASGIPDFEVKMEYIILMKTAKQNRKIFCLILSLSNGLKIFMSSTKRKCSMKMLSRVLLISILPD